MKSVNKIPTSKVQRASTLLKTGAKVGGNYVKYYANRVTKSKEEANQRDTKIILLSLYLILRDFLKHKLHLLYKV